ncbi:carboxylesterase/lipase family protein [Algibacter mikhailovii]|uniref:carboxylesterase/lipase family protein n=1 Tax=Algibacter mikhailovii TaxID=425498 RepID=UPI002494E6A9|nr:carboxylesterase family protein [Algibacter mikhailovii]
MNKFFMILFVLVFINNNALSQNPLQKKIDSGIIEGVLSEQDAQVEKYLGIPYAQPPVGDLRWKAPLKLIPWQGVLKTQKYSKKAMQPLIAKMPWLKKDTFSEDCLYLNVWKPRDIGVGKLPVLVIIHGGGLMNGGTIGPTLEGSNMAKKGMVVVTVNYRLNIFGFFAHQELSAETAHNGSGNYGYMDQQFALQWIKKNIEVFGGDPNRITVAGESAGAWSVLTLISSPLSKDLVARAIGSSGGVIPLLSMEEAEKRGTIALNKSGHKTISELRKASTEEILDIYNKGPRFAYMPTVDNYVFPKQIADIYKAKEQADIPLLIGWNSSEQPFELFLGEANYSKGHFVNRTKEMYPEHFEKILEMFPHETENEIKWSATYLSSIKMTKKAWKWFDLHCKYNNQPVFRYLFSKIPPPHKTVDLSTYTPPLGVLHAKEIEYFWGNLALRKGYNYSEDDYNVSALMQEYLSNFVKSGNPNGDQLPEWPAVNPNSESPMILNIDTQTKLIPASNDLRLRFMDNEGLLFQGR